MQTSAHFWQCDMQNLCQCYLIHGTISRTIFVRFTSSFLFHFHFHCVDMQVPDQIIKVHMPARTKIPTAIKKQRNEDNKKNSNKTASNRNTTHIIIVLPINMEKYAGFVIVWFGVSFFLFYLISLTLWLSRRIPRNVPQIAHIALQIYDAIQTICVAFFCKLFDSFVILSMDLT